MNIGKNVWWHMLHGAVPDFRSQKKQEPGRPDWNTFALGDIHWQHSSLRHSLTRKILIKRHKLTLQLYKSWFSSPWNAIIKLWIRTYHEYTVFCIWWRSDILVIFRAHLVFMIDKVSETSKHTTGLNSEYWWWLIYIWCKSTVLLHICHTDVQVNKQIQMLKFSTNFCVNFTSSMFPGVSRSISSLHALWRFGKNVRTHLNPPGSIMYQVLLFAITRYYCLQLPGIIICRHQVLLD